MVTSDPVGDIHPLYLKDVTNARGKVQPRLVNTDSQKFQLVCETGMQYITEADYEAAGEYLPNPEEYDFFKILEW
jgi:6-phosphofructokinase 1